MKVKQMNRTDGYFSLAYLQELSEISLGGDHFILHEFIEFLLAFLKTINDYRMSD